MLQMKTLVSFKVLLLLDIGEEFSTMLEDTGKNSYSIRLKQL